MRQWPFVMALCWLAPLSAWAADVSRWPMISRRPRRSYCRRDHARLAAVPASADHLARQQGRGSREIRRGRQRRADLRWLSRRALDRGAQLSHQDRVRRTHSAGPQPKWTGVGFQPGAVRALGSDEHDLAPMPGEANYAARLAEWERQEGWRHVGGGPAADLVDGNCFLCHLREADNQARVGWTGRGLFAWATRPRWLHRPGHSRRRTRQ